MGGIILYALFAPQVRRPLLMAIGIIFGGFVVARIISIAMDGYAPMLGASLGSEVVAPIILLAAAQWPAARPPLSHPGPHGPSHAVAAKGSDVTGRIGGS